MRPVYLASLLARESLRLVEKRDWHALANTPGEVEGIPIGEPDAAMGLGLADLFGSGRPVNAVTCLGQIDPDQPYGIVGTGRDGELSISPHTFELELRIVVIGGVLDNPAHVVSTAWCWFFATADRCRIESDQFVVAPKRANDFGRLIDLDFEDPPLWPTIRNVGNGDDCAGSIQCTAGIKQLEQGFTGMKFFR